jgi:hypothetical protein
MAPTSRPTQEPSPTASSAASALRWPMSIPALATVDHLAAVGEQLASLAVIDGLDLAVDQQVALRGDFRRRELCLGALRLLAVMGGELEAVVEAQVAGIQFLPGLASSMRTSLRASAISWRISLPIPVFPAAAWAR